MYMLLRTLYMLIYRRTLRCCCSHGIPYKKKYEQKFNVQDTYSQECYYILSRLKLFNPLYIVVYACKYVEGIMYASIIRIKISEYIPRVWKLLYILFQSYIAKQIFISCYHINLIIL